MPPPHPAPAPARPKPREHNQRHLIVVQHGLWGSTYDVQYIHTKVAEKCGPDARVVSCDVNGV